MAFAHVNVRSLLANFLSLQDHLLQKRYDVLGVTETWLHGGVGNEAVNIAGYTFVRLDRSFKRGGGVGFYIRDNIKFSMILSDSTDCVEHLWLKVVVARYTYAVGVLYRPPSSSQEQFLIKFEDCLVTVYNDYTNIICLGDFNIDMLNGGSSAGTLGSLADTFDLRQVIQEPTRISRTTVSLIDLVFCNCDVCDVGVVDAGIADHCVVFLNLARFNAFEPVKQITYRNFKYFNLDSFTVDLEAIPFNHIFFIDDIDGKVEYLSDCIDQLFNLHAPFITIKIGRKPVCPWITDNVKLLQNLRDNALTRYKQTRSPEHWTYYKDIRNYTNKVIKLEKKAYLGYRLQNSTVKEKWRELKKLNIVGNKKAHLPERFGAEVVSSHFASIYDNFVSPDPSTFAFYRNNTHGNFNSQFEFSFVSAQDILNIISRIKTKSVGVDGISAMQLQLCSPQIIPYVTHIINECLRRSYFPLAWKHANIIPIPKNNHPTELNHLRSISVLPILSKILERVMEAQIRRFVEDKKILPDKQSGFRSNYGCSSAMADVTDDIFRAIDDHKVCILVLLDYSKAFDTISHQLLLSILHYYSFSQSAIDLVESFLTDRVQRVILRGTASQPVSVASGVPQGSVLGPLLFSIYTSRLFDCIKFCKYHLYADDTQLYRASRRDQLNNAITEINRDLDSLLHTSRSHSLILNPEKSSVIVFGADNTEALDIRLQMNGSALPVRSTVRSLGLFLDSGLRFREHVSVCLRRAYYALKLLFAHRHSLETNTKLMLCDSLVLSQLNFCDVVYGPCLDCASARRIQVLQNSCLRFAYGVRRRQHISSKLLESGWLNMYHRRILHMLCFYFKIIQTRTPPYLHERLTYRTDVHNLNIRRRTLLTIPKHRGEVFKRSFSYCIVNLLNSFYVASCGTLGAFRVICRERLLDRQSVV